jgi:ubiquinol-cytochrome c reductase cytochrome b subunit
VWFWLLIIDLIILTVYGKLPPTGFNAWIGFFSSVGFLVLLLVVLPIITIRERKANK